MDTKKIIVLYLYAQWVYTVCFVIQSKIPLSFKSHWFCLAHCVVNSSLNFTRKTRLTLAPRFSWNSQTYTFLFVEIMQLLTKFALGAIKAVVRANKKGFAFAFALFLNGSSTNNSTIPGRKTAFAFAVALCINGPLYKCYVKTCFTLHIKLTFLFLFTLTHVTLLVLLPVHVCEYSVYLPLDTFCIITHYFINHPLMIIVFYSSSLM